MELVKARVVGETEEKLGAAGVAGGGMGASAGETRQLPEGVWTEAYSAGEVVEPPYDLETLASLYESNSTHKACVDAKTINIVGLGHRFVPTAGGEKSDPQNLALLEHLFATCNPEMTFTEPILLGMDKAVHVLQRGSEVADIVNIAALAVLDAQDRGAGRR